MGLKTVESRGPRNNGIKRNDWDIPVRAKWRPLYDEDEDFRLWFHNVARGSPTTAVERARVLYRFLSHMGWELDELTRQITEDRDMLEKRLMEFVGSQEDLGYAPGTIENYMKSVKSWANWHGVKLVRKIKISNRTSTPTLDLEKVPTVDEVQAIRSSGTPRGRICVGVVAYGGARPEVLGHQHVKDGLRLGDLPELDIDKLQFTAIPTLVVVRKEISKSGNTYRTFLPKETCMDIVTYLHKRRSKGEELTRESPLVAVKPALRRKGWRVRNGDSDSLHIVTTVVSRDIRNAMRPAYGYRPYVLRSFFSTRLLMAVSARVLDNNYRVYWMGHKGEMSARYSSNKDLLPDDLIESMREAYKRSLSYLTGGTISQEEMRKKQMMDTARLLGFSEEKLTKLEGIIERARTADEGIQEFRRLEGIPKQNDEGFRRLGESPKQNNGNHVIVSDEENMLSLLSEGGELIQELNDGRFLLRIT